MWILLALTAAVCTALRDVASKHATRGADPLVIAFGMTAIPAAVLGALALALGPARPAAGFGRALLVSGGINAVATPLIIHALERSDLSLVTPLRSLTPLFMIPVAAVVLAEWPSAAGGAGVAVIVAGAYLLNLSDRTAGPLEPFRAILRDPGARLMLLVAFLYSVSATFDKVGTQASSPIFWAASLQGVVALVLAPMAGWRWHAARRARRSPPRHTGGAGGAPRWWARPAVAIVLAGLLAAVAAAAQMTALTLTLAAYVIAVKRTSGLWSVLLGHSLFRETGVGERLAGAAVMLVGLLILTLG